MLKKILWSNQRQLIGAVIGAFLGLLLLLSALQLYYDVASLTEAKGEDRFVLVNKKVNIFNTLGAPSVFTPEELDTLLQQDFVTDIGKFTPNQFKVSASSSMLGFYTELFFESVEDAYLDIHPSKFAWKEGQREIPVIISRDYLALYNFGFAPSQGLPQFTQNTIKKVSVDLTISGRGLQQTFSGRIVGFSDRFNSILVPQSFMSWANSRFGNRSNNQISRLILATDNPYSPTLEQYLKDNDLEVSRGRLIGGQVGIMLNIILSVLGLIGLLIVLLAVLVFALSFELLISRSSAKISLLLQLGYRTKQLSDILIRRLFIILGATILGVLVLLGIGHILLSKWLTTQSYFIDAFLHPNVLILSLLLSLAFFIVLRRLIKKRVTELFQ